MTEEMFKNVVITALEAMMADQKSDQIGRKGLACLFMSPPAISALFKALEPRK